MRANFRDESSPMNTPLNTFNSTYNILLQVSTRLRCNFSGTLGNGVLPYWRFTLSTFVLLSVSNHTLRVDMFYKNAIRKYPGSKFTKKRKLKPAFGTLGLQRCNIAHSPHPPRLAPRGRKGRTERNKLCTLRCVTIITTDNKQYYMVVVKISENKKKTLFGRIPLNNARPNWFIFDSVGFGKGSRRWCFQTWRANRYKNERRRPHPPRARLDPEIVQTRPSRFARFFYATTPGVYYLNTWKIVATGCCGGGRRVGSVWSGGSYLKCIYIYIYTVSRSRVVVSGADCVFAMPLLYL